MIIEEWHGISSVAGIARNQRFQQSRKMADHSFLQIYDQTGKVRLVVEACQNEFVGSLLCIDLKSCNANVTMVTESKRFK